MSSSWTNQPGGLKSKASVFVRRGGSQRKPCEDEAEAGLRQPQPRGPPMLPATTSSQEEGQAQSIPQRLLREDPLPTPSLQISSFQNYFKPPTVPSLWSFLTMEENTALRWLRGWVSHVCMYKETFTGNQGGCGQWRVAERGQGSQMRDAGRGQMTKAFRATVRTRAAGLGEMGNFELSK